MKIWGNHLLEKCFKIKAVKLFKNFTQKLCELPNLPFISFSEYCHTPSRDFLGRLIK